MKGVDSHRKTMRTRVKWFSNLFLSHFKSSTFSLCDIRFAKLRNQVQATALVYLVFRVLVVWSNAFGQLLM